MQFTAAPAQSAIDYLTNTQVTSTDNNNTPSTTLDNPFPSGLTAAPGRSPSYQQALLGGNPTAVQSYEENGLTYQWNLAVQRQLPKGVALEVAYVGLRGNHLPISHGINQVPEQYLSQAANNPLCVGPTANPSSATTTCPLTAQVTNPFTNITQGALQKATVTNSQLLRPYPQYASLANPSNYVGISNYQALQAKVEKRFAKGGVLLGTYTFSKLLANAESLTTWLDSATFGGGYQDLNNLQAPGEYSLSGFDSRQRLVVSYVYSLPFGHNQKFLANTSGFMDRVISGFGFNGVTTFQQGYPLGLIMAQNNIGTYGLDTSARTRPDVVEGCAKSIGGPIQKRLGDARTSSNTVANPYYNYNCFQAPATPFSFGNESRLDNQLRGPGIANFDLALYKDTNITEKVALQLRIESFNLFNRVQFGTPQQAIGNAQNGQITTQLNQPRLLQVAGRINF